MKPTWLGGTVVAIGILAVVLAIATDGGDPQRHLRTAGTLRSRSAGENPTELVLPAQPTADPRQLAVEIDRAQQIIDDPTSTNRQLASAGLFEQLATGALQRETDGNRRTVLASLAPRAATTMRANLDASSALGGLTTPERRLPPWSIIRPPPPDTLRGYFTTAQSRFRVAWQYLAAIELIETRFGRIRGPSSAGAQGPMQFLPASWAAYGNGNIDDQRDAILAAARLLVAVGAPRDMAGALYHYNPSLDYVRAVRDYASSMRADPRAYYGYYYWQVLYDWTRGLLILPVGYPHAKPLSIQAAGSR